MKSLRSAPVPKIAQALVPREMLSWALVSICLAAVEGGVVGVLVKNLYADVADPLWVNVCVALVSGAPAFANILSFVFAVHAQGKDKVRLLSQLMGLFSASTALIAFSPLTAGGLVLLTLGMVMARVFWAATITVRAAVWRANFPRQVRARVTGQMATLSSVVIALTSTLIGYLLDVAEDYFRWVWLITVLAGAASAVIYSKAKVRGHRAMLKREREKQLSVGLTERLAQFREVLKGDRDFRDYMIGMFIFGSGNMMMMAPLIVIMNEVFYLSRFSQVLITSTVPLATLAMSIPLWARLFDGSHIIDFRARQSWSFVTAILFFSMAVLFKQEYLLWLGGAAIGVAYAGGNLGWNLGHNDFTDDSRATIYMGIHVTLTGVRGLIMPPLGVLFYEYLKQPVRDLDAYTLLLPLLLNTTGALWFVYLKQRRQQRAATL